MLEQSVKLSRLKIFYFISNFLIYIRTNSSKQRAKNQCFSQCFHFLSSFSAPLQLFRSQKQMWANANHCGFETGPEADPNFAPFRWRIWLGPSEFLCLLANQNATFVTLFCTQLPFFCTVLPKNCISLSQSQSRNFFMYIINALKRAFSFLSPFIRIHTYEKQMHKVNYCLVIWVIRFYETSIKSLIIFCNITECEGGLTGNGVTTTISTDTTSVCITDWSRRQNIDTTFI